MRSTLLLATLLLAGVPAAASPFGSPPLSEAELASLRGGIQLPNGLDLSVGIAIETYVDGRLALRTTVTTDDGIQVFGSRGIPQPQIRSPVPRDTAPAPPAVQIDRAGKGTVIVPAVVVPSVQINVSRGPSQMPAKDGLPLAVSPNGAPVITSFGAVSLEQTDRGSVVILSDPTLQLRHLVGSATGIVVANTANDRAIDTVATVGIDLRNASTLVGSNLLGIDRIVTDAVSRNLTP